MSSYADDMEALIVEGVTGLAGSDYVELLVKQGNGDDVRHVCIARPLLLTIEFFVAMLEGGFAETRDFAGSSLLEVSADNPWALVLCFRLLATGNRALIPDSAPGVLAVLVEAHRLCLSDIVSVAELALVRIVEARAVDAETHKSLAQAAELFDLPKLACELDFHSSK